MLPPLRSLACPRCTMVQVVPADSPRGPALRLRCLACHASLFVDDDVTRLTAGLEVAAAPLGGHWYVVSEGEVVGPITRDDIERLHTEGSLTDDALVWHLGFRAWARLSNTATFCGRVGGRRPAPRRQPPTVLDLTAHADLIEPGPMRRTTSPRRRTPPPLRAPIGLPRGPRSVNTPGA